MFGDSEPLRSKTIHYHDKILQEEVPFLQCVLKFGGGGKRIWSVSLHFSAVRCCRKLMEQLSENVCSFKMRGYKCQGDDSANVSLCLKLRFEQDHQMLADNKGKTKLGGFLTFLTNQSALFKL